MATPHLPSRFSGSESDHVHRRDPELGSCSPKQDEIGDIYLSYVQNVVNGGASMGSLERPASELPPLPWEDEKALPSPYDRGSDVSMYMSSDTDDGNEDLFERRRSVRYNLTTMREKQRFIINLSRALLMYGAPSHRIEAQLHSAANIIRLNGSFVHLPGVIICAFRNREARTGETHFVKRGGRIALGKLHSVHVIFRRVVHDEISAERGADLLEELIKSPPQYGILFSTILAFLISFIICGMSFGGTLIDMPIAAILGVSLAGVRNFVAARSPLYSNVFEITIATIISFISRGLSSIRVGGRQFFCYTSISSASIVGILPGFLILSSGLEIASRKIVSGSVKLVYALIYALFLGFGLQIGSDFFLVFYPTERQRLVGLAQQLSRSVTLAGTLTADNMTDFPYGEPIGGVWTFTNNTDMPSTAMNGPCYRPSTNPWWLTPFPRYSLFVLVPIFSVLSSLNNQQPWKSWELPAMCAISCASYAVNKISNIHFPGRPDVVAALGASAVGVLGNVYARATGGTAFTAMVTGVLFLTPSVFAEAGGVAAGGSGIDIGGKILEVTIGVTVGLLMTQAVVYLFGSKGKSAAWSF